MATDPLFITNYISIRYKLYTFSPPDPEREEDASVHDEALLHLCVHYFAAGIDDDTIINTVVWSQHRSAYCSRSYLKTYIERHEPFPMEFIMRREDAELMREGMSTTVGNVVREAAGVPGMERLRVDVKIKIFQMEVDEQVHRALVGEYAPDGSVLDDGTRGNIRMGLMEKRVHTGKHVAGGGGDEVCAVCLEEMAVGVEVVWTPCKHQFHGECLTSWFERAGSCPLCRFNFDHLLFRRPVFSSRFVLQFT